MGGTNSGSKLTILAMDFENLWIRKLSHSNSEWDCTLSDSPDVQSESSPDLQPVLEKHVAFMA